MATATANKGNGKATKGKKADGKAKPVKAAKPVDPKRVMAKAAGINLSLWNILNVLANTGPKDAMTYKQMAEKGIPYSPLTAQTRKQHEGSLGALGLIGEDEAFEMADGSTKLAFYITAKGKQALAKGKAAK